MNEALEVKRSELLAAGVIMMDPCAVWVEEQVTVGKGTVLLPGTILRGSTTVGENCTIGPNVMLTDTTVEDNVTINNDLSSFADPDNKDYTLVEGSAIFASVPDFEPIPFAKIGCVD